MLFVAIFRILDPGKEFLKFCYRHSAAVKSFITSAGYVFLLTGFDVH